MAEIINFPQEPEGADLHCPACGEFGWFARFVDVVFYLECMNDECGAIVVICGDPEEI